MDSPEREYLRRILIYQKEYRRLLAEGLSSVIPNLRQVIELDKESSAEDIQTYDYPRYDSVNRTDSNIDDELKKLFESIQRQMQIMFPDGTLRKWSKNMVGHVNSVSKNNTIKAAKSVDLEIEPLMKDNKLNPFFDNIVDQNVGLIRSIGAEQQIAFKNALVNAITNGWPQARIAEMIQKHFKATKVKSRLIARDQVNKLNGQLNQYRQQQLGGKKYIWRTAQDERVRDDHKALDGTPQFWSDPPVTNKRTGARNHPGQDFQCIPGYIEVGIEQPIDVLYRRFYRGKLLGFLTDSGEVLETTPNHPILTQHGWLPARQVRLGDYMITATHPSLDDLPVQDARVQTRIEDLFESFRSVSETHLKQSILTDFHGDAGVNQEIEMIDAKSIARDDSRPHSLYDIVMLALSLTPGTMALWNSHSDFKKLIVALKQLQHLFSGDSFDSSKIIDTLYDLNLMLEQGELSFNPSRPTQSTHTTRRKKTQPPLEVLHEIIRKLHTVPSWRDQLNVSYPDAYSMDQIAKSNFDESRLQNAINPFSNCKIKYNKITELRDIDFRGHVYNLQTKSNWFVAAGQVLHNCRCHAEMDMKDIIE